MTATSSASPPSPPAAAVFRPPPTRRRILHPEPDQMQREEGFILWEWRRRWDFLVDPIISRFEMGMWKVLRYLNLGSERWLWRSTEVTDETTYKVIWAGKEELLSSKQRRTARTDLLIVFMKLRDEDGMLCPAKMPSSLRRRGRKRNVEIKLFAEAEQYKQAFYERGKLNCETNKLQNREREKIANIEKRGKKEEQKPSFVVIHRPKPGKPTDLSTMCQILVKLKHTPTPPASSPAKDVAAADEISVTEGQPVKPEVHMKLDVPQLQWSSGDGNAICGL
ncbi:Clathrin light chain [Musa troglodytarum]|uniref:Clathrin light chain n=1 Tax=Musa troglodytarum TaxID=320322 RepID=A0A9E7F2L4_9LILI|nr:Clathrin light chain [Musa troglodytarum]